MSSWRTSRSRSRAAGRGSGRRPSLILARFHVSVVNMRNIRDGVPIRQATTAMTALVLLFGCALFAIEAAAQPSFTYLSAPAPAKTVRYWDCCKASGSWPGKAPVNSPVAACAKDGVTRVDPNARNVCGGGGTSGPSYMCNNQQPFVVNASLSYGFAAANLVGKSESDTSCACYALQFTSGPVTGQTHVVQVLNLGASASTGSSRFDLLIPGGGVGIFNGCQDQWGAPSDGWGPRYGGVTSPSECAKLPSQLQAGCNWRFAWFKNADNPTATFRRVKCPAELVAKTNCKRKDE
jgi:hypothetical protein